MPERDAATCNLGDGYLLTAAGLRREKSGDLTADLILENGRILFAGRGVCNTPEGRLAWATKAQTPDGPTAERMAEALQEHVLPDALAILQADPKKPTQADLLVGMVSELSGDFAADVAGDVELFHDPAGTAYATIPVGDHRETWPLGSKGFRQWMARRYHEQHGKTPNAQALADATQVLAGKAIFDGPEYRVHVRLAEHDGAIFLDLTNERWEAVAIDRTGWRIVANPPVRFRRSRGMLPLPIPLAGGNLATLRRFINVPTDDASVWTLIVAWLVAALRARGPYPVLVVMGEQGCAKSTLMRVLRALLDPNKAPIRTLPRDERDLMIAAANSWCSAYDNLSRLPDWQSDALCRLSTGGGLAVRELYSDLDETILDAQRPVMLNGIEEVVTRNDLLDRSIVVYLPSIPRAQRRPEKALWQAFERERPALFGALLDAVSAGLANEGRVSLTEHPRMADFSEWIVAAEPALPWRPGQFMAALVGNQQDANDLTLEASAVAQAVREFIQKRAEPWTGTATDLLNDLQERVTDQTTKQKSWPGSGQALSNTLRRLAPNLRAAGVVVTFGERKHGGRRIIQVERIPTEQEDTEASPASPASPAASAQGNLGDASAGGDTSQRRPDSEASPASEQESTQRRGDSAAGDTGDDGDTSASSYSGQVCAECGMPIPASWIGYYCERHGSRPADDGNDDDSDQPRLCDVPAPGDPDRWTR